MEVSEHFVDLQHSYLYSLMNKRERSAVIQVFSVFVDIDILSVLQQMRMFNYISRQTYSKCLGQIKDKTFPEKMSILLKIVQRVLTFDDFVLVLRLTRHDAIAKELVREKFKRVHNSPARMYIQHSRKIQRFYKVQKGHVDNKIFNISTTEYLLSVIRGLDETIGNPTANFTIRQESLERKVAFYVLLVQQYSDRNKRLAVMNKLRMGVPDDLDRNSLEIVFHSKMAITEARAKHTQKYESHLRAAHVIFDNCKPCFATLSNLHDIQYIRLTLHNQHPTKENLKAVIDAGNLIIQSIEGESVEVQEFWKRLALQYMILCLLRITSSFEVDDIEYVSKENLMLAKSLLKEACKLNVIIETRRLMILALCQARVHEPDDLDKAIRYTWEALSYSDSGTFFKHELKNIKRYLNWLILKNFLHKYFQWRVIFKWMFLLSLLAFLLLFFLSDSINMYILELIFFGR